MGPVDINFLEEKTSKMGKLNLNSFHSLTLWLIVQGIIINVEKTKNLFSQHVIPRH
jgi:hypothetical protein